MIKGGAITVVQMIIFFSFQILLGGYVYFVISCGSFKNAGLRCIRDSLTYYIDGDTKTDKSDKEDKVQSEKAAKEKAAKEKAAKEKAAKEKAAEEKAAKEKAAKEKAAKEKAAKEKAAKEKAEAAAKQKNKIINTTSAQTVLPDELKQFADDEDVMSVLANIDSAIPSVDDFFGGSNNIYNNKIPFILLLILLYLICFK